MSTTEKNYSVFDVGLFSNLGEKEIDGNVGRIMLGKALGLTGCEISFNSRPANTSTPFVHSHKLNEEVYIIVGGSGMFYVDGEEFPVQEGSAVRIAPGGKRVIKSGNKGMTFICIQAQNDSLTQATSEDGILNEEKASWM